MECDFSKPFGYERNGDLDKVAGAANAIACSKLVGFFLSSGIPDWGEGGICLTQVAPIGSVRGSWKNTLET
jgi:hypothetical protein